MKGICLKFYAYEFQKHRGILLYEWLLEFAKKEGVEGGTAFRAIAGFGRHKNLHEEHFFELAANVPIEVTFILDKKDSSQFLEVLKKEKLDLFYTKTAIEYEDLNA